MVTDAMSAKEIAEFLANRDALTAEMEADQAEHDEQPKRRGGRPKKDAEKE